MRRDVRRHPNGDPRRAVRQKVRKTRGQNRRFFQSAFIIRAEVDRVLGQPFHKGLGSVGQTRLGVAFSGRVVPVDISEVPLPVDERVAHVEILRQTRHRVVNRLVPVRVIVAHHVARNLGRFPEAACRREPEFPHRKQDTAMDGFQPVPRVRQGPVHDRRQRIGQIPVRNRAAQRLCRVRLVDIGGICVVCHR